MTSRSFQSFIEQKMGKVPHFMIYAILEWIMIILLFIDGFLAFISNEFARFFELRIPCLLCTRIDHILVHRSSNFYYNESICEVHKRDMSSLAYCHMHKKLSDIRCMCEGCLLSFATGRESDCEKYKSLVGILHRDIECFVDDDNRMKYGKKDDVDIVEDKSSVPRCTCCGEPLKIKPSTFKRSLSMNAPAPSPSPRAPLLPSRFDEGRNTDLPNHRFSELKFVSDADSELLHEDEVVPSIVDNQRREDNKVAAVPLVPDSEEMNEDFCKTPSFARGNKFFGIPLSDSAQASPRWGVRAARKLPFDFSDSNDASSLNEADGDSILNRLKKQVRLDQKSLIALYMELDEERSASAVAANNAMAMITRLQAEKAAVQMEALQYQRMMEEQAEYDQEALQVMKDMLFKRDEDIKVLESELELYREKYGPIKKVNSDSCELDAEEDYQELKSHSFSSFSEKSDCGSLNGTEQQEGERPYDRSMEYGGTNPEESLLDFEAEKSYLLSLLTDLQEKISPSSDKGSNSLETDRIHDEDKGKANEEKATLTGEVSLIRERLRAIEADSGFLKHAAMTLQRGSEGTKLLTEIAQHLRKLRHSVKDPIEDTVA